MKANELKNLSSEELVKKLNDLKDELFKLRFQLATNQLENPMRIREVRRTIARFKTILRQRELQTQEA
ncbi:MAG: 50S ribosomal protein L29 [Thermincolia bacterium]